MKVPGINPQPEVEVELELENKGSNEVERVLQPLSAAEKSVVRGMLQGDEVEEVQSVEIVRGMRGVVDDGQSNASGPTMLVPLQQVGVHATTLANVLLEGLKARKQVMVGGNLKKVPDHAVRLKFLELAHKLRGDYPSSAAHEQQAETYEARIRTVMHRVQGKVSKAIASVDNKVSDTINDR